MRLIKERAGRNWRRPEADPREQLRWRGEQERGGPTARMMINDSDQLPETKTFLASSLNISH